MTIKLIYGLDVLNGLKQLDDESVDCVITSPPYFGLRDYQTNGQIGLEKSLNEYIGKILLVTLELKRVLKKTGTMFWNHGDSYGTGSGSGIRTGKQATNRGSCQKNGKSKVAGYQKCLLLQNFRLVQRMIDEQSWILRNILIWHKPNAMPSSVKDRFSVDFEPVFFFSKSRKYFFEQQFEPYTEPLNRWRGNELKASGKSIWDEGTGQSTYRDRNMRPNVNGRNKRCVWSIPTKPFSGAHFATFPPALIDPMIRSGCPEFICKKCKKAREKIIEYSGGTIGRSWHDHKADKEKGMLQTHSSIGLQKNEAGESYQRIEKGLSDCKCNVGFKPGVVLDPFGGSGTVAEVAMKLGRDSILIDLNKDYEKLAREKLGLFYETSPIPNQNN